MKKLLLLPLILVQFSSILYSQVPIGMNINDGKSKLKAALNTHGYTFLKEVKTEFKKSNNDEYDFNDTPTDYSVTLLYKEELSALIFYNNFDNIESVWFSLSQNKSKSLNNQQKLELFLKMGFWELIGKGENEFISSKHIIYKYKNMKIIHPIYQIGDIFQYNFFTIE